MKIENKQCTDAYWRSLFYIPIILIAVLLISLSQDVHAQKASQPMLNTTYQRLYDRSLRYDKMNPNEVSRWANHLWMAYLADSTQASVLKDLSVVYSLMEQPQEATKLLISAFRHSGYDRYIGFDLIEMASNTNQLQLAEETCLRLLEATPDKPELLAKLVDIYLAQMNGAKALETLDRLIALDDHNTAFLLQKTQILNIMDRSKEAEDILLEIMKENPNDVAAMTSLFTLYGDQERYDEANKLLQRLHTVSPQSTFIYELSALLKLKQNDFNGAVNEVRRVSQLEGTSPETLEAMISTLIQKSPNFRSILRALIPLQKELIKSYPETPSFALALSRTYIIEKDQEKAEVLLQRLVDQQVNDPYPYTYFTEKYARNEQIQELYDITNKGVQIFPENGLFNLYCMFAAVQLEKDKSEILHRIDQALEHVLEVDTNYSALLLLKADLLQEEGKIKEAFQTYEKAISYNSDNALAYNNYAYSLSTYGEKPDLKKAEALSSKAIKLMPNSPSFLDTYAWILYLQGNYAVAKIYMENAISRMTSDEDQQLYYEHYAKILEKLGDLDAAIQAWQSAIAHGRDAEETHKHIEKIKKELAPLK